jgi:hypothetical protein
MYHLFQEKLQFWIYHRIQTKNCILGKQNEPVASVVPCRFCYIAKKFFSRVSPTMTGPRTPSNPDKTPPSGVRADTPPRIVSYAIGSITMTLFHAYSRARSNEITNDIIFIDCIETIEIEANTSHRTTHTLGTGPGPFGVGRASSAPFFSYFPPPRSPGRNPFLAPGKPTKT